LADEPDRLLAAGRYEEAEVACIKALAHAPTDARLYYLLGISLWEQRRFAEAERAYRQTLGLQPRSAEAHCALGNALLSQRREEDACLAFEMASRLKPKLAEAHHGLARALIELRRPEEALGRCRRALALEPANWEYHTVLGNALRELQRFDEAIAAFRRAVALAPPSRAAVPKFNLAFVLLCSGDLQAGWPLYEARLEVGDGNWLPREKPAFEAPVWKGEDLSGKRIIIWPEQGYGDGIYFARYVPALKRLGGHVTLACPAPLRALFESVRGVDALVGTEQARSGEYDYWVHIGSIPARLPGPATVRNDVPYLAADAARIERWRAELPANGFKVGLTWKGRPEFGHDRFRSLPSFSVLRPLWDVAGVSFVSLQKGVDENVPATADQPMSQLGSSLGDFAETAAALSAIDLLISSDTAIVHLAGALARPVWLLVPSYHADWRWPRQGTHCAWYPKGMRLFHQGADGGWEKTIAAVRDALQVLIK
jgi:Flp pilus assembly protein TadD